MYYHYYHYVRITYWIVYNDIVLLPLNLVVKLYLKSILFFMHIDQLLYTNGIEHLIEFSETNDRYKIEFIS